MRVIKINNIYECCNYCGGCIIRSNGDNFTIIEENIYCMYTCYHANRKTKYKTK